MTNPDRRLIEVAFPLKQASLDSVHEKNVRHGHISTLHIWPARRPLAASRAALIATLLPDPGNEQDRRKLVEKIGGRVIEKVDKDGNVEERTEGGVLRWGNESGPDMDWFREKIREAYGGRAPRVLDPFAGGGAIPLEAMRLGCEVTAVDINPVAWFILKCTLEYPQKLAGQKRPLPDFALKSPEFMEHFFKRTGNLSKPQLQKQVRSAAQGLFPQPDVDLSWHVRAWGHWVLERAKHDLRDFYPTYASFETVTKKPERRSEEIRRVPLRVDGSLDVAALNAEFTMEYLGREDNPRWVEKATVAYLWTRTVTCKSCRATVPLLKTTWMAKRGKKRIRLVVTPKQDRTGVQFAIQEKVPSGSDKDLGAGTMSRSGAECPCCSTIMTMQDIRLEGKAERLGSLMMAVVVDGQKGKEYRLPTQAEIDAAAAAAEPLDGLFGKIPFGLPVEPTPKGGSGASRAFSVDGYGFDQWHKMFSPRQLLAMGTYVRHIRDTHEELLAFGYSSDWTEAILSYLTCGLDRMLDFNAQQLSWITSVEAIGHVFVRYALPITWDFSEAAPINSVRGGFEMCVDKVCESIETISTAARPDGIVPDTMIRSAIDGVPDRKFDIICTDPPYYDAIPYSDLMDFFYVWLRRSLHNISPAINSSFLLTNGPKWNHQEQNGELIDDAARFGGDGSKSKKSYEDGMARAFQASYKSLEEDGRLVIVFANKNPNAWETLVSAIIRAGFVVDGSWPIETEQAARMRAQSSAALSSSIWLVCKKRSRVARPGWDSAVLQEMRTNISDQLRAFWDAGIRGPDFVWAATGPAMEAYSKYPVVKKANDPGQVMTVDEFLRHVRREVVDFAVGRVLSRNGHAEGTTGLDDVTAYYLLHRNDFGMDAAPMGACILYALSCGLSDSELTGRLDLLVQEKEEARLKGWKSRTSPKLGYEAPGGVVPIIDELHRLMHLWKAGDVQKVNEYVDERGIKKSAIFAQVLQALIELSEGDERATLESISNHLKAQGVRFQSSQVDAFQE